MNETAYQNRMYIYKVVITYIFSKAEKFIANNGPDIINHNNP